MFPCSFGRYLEAFGGSGSVLLGMPPNAFEAYNDYNHSLVNLFRCIRDRPMALLNELGFLPLNSRDDFKVLVKFFKREEFVDDYLGEEFRLTRQMLPEPEANELIELRNTQAQDYDVRRAAMFFRKIRYSYSSMGKSYASQPFDIAKTFNLIWDVSRRLKNVVIENQSFEVFIRHYDRPDALIYCDPPYLETESMYDAPFSLEHHKLLREVFGSVKGKMLISYNDCDEIRRLYEGSGCWFFDFRRAHYMALKTTPGAEFPELLIANYDIYERQRNKPAQISFFTQDRGLSEQELEQIMKECIIHENK